MYQITLPAFSGPLDLLLKLIEREELDITTIALAQVADQYLAHVRSLAAPEPRALAEFVSMAARLLLIKSRALLPRPTLDSKVVATADPDAEALAAQLREYRQYKEVARLLRAWQEEERQSFLRLAPMKVELELKPVPVQHTLGDLIAALQRRIQLTLPIDEATVINLQPRLTVAEVGQRVRERLSRQPWCSLSELLGPQVCREDVIVTFWAVLELLKRQVITLEQPELFGPISLGRGAAYEPIATIGERSVALG
ncbi:segregation and condensation protein A [Candidatus Viridilinea mediisalina]|uniref:Segregation and condensation protein A n=1 Tax=Candidatus Viridilinea mediisalina TaxID=2024553 RepID=A0A2A6RKL5_9CHLR|nr:segregation/condensation protein A [Candidatus Viridilinea mediisalina]PDW03451.1 segregation/condensation protein A [Candidatus Viridilinea mediisalina]